MERTENKKLFYHVYIFVFIYIFGSSIYIGIHLTKFIVFIYTNSSCKIYDDKIVRFIIFRG